MHLARFSVLLCSSFGILLGACAARVPSDPYAPTRSAPAWPLPPLGDTTDHARASDTAEIRVWSSVSIGVPRGPMLRLRQYGGRTWGEYYVRYAALPDGPGLEEDSFSWARVARDQRDTLIRRYGCRAFAVAEREGICRAPFRYGEPNWSRLWQQIDAVGDSVLAVGPADNPSSREVLPDGSVRVRTGVLCMDGSGVIMERRRAGASRVERPPFWVCERSGARARERERLEDVLYGYYLGVDSLAAGDLRTAGAP